MNYSELLEKLSAVMTYHNRGDDGTETGASINRDSRSSVISKDIPIHHLMPYEPSQEKVKGVQNRQTLDSLVKTIKSGNRHQIPPITVMKHPVLPGKYIILDGHHRMEGHLKAGSKTVRAEIVSDKNVKYDVD